MVGIRSVAVTSKYPWKEGASSSSKAPSSSGWGMPSIGDAHAVSRVAHRRISSSSGGFPALVASSMRKG
jgi:hypothetical protein